MSIESVMPSSCLIFCHPLFLLPSIFSSIRVFSNKSALWIRWPNYYSFCFSISPSKEYSELISFRIDWFDLLAVQRTLKRLLQHHNSKALILWYLALFVVQLSHPYMTTGKTIALLVHTFVSKVISVLFNMQSMLFMRFSSKDQVSFNITATVTIHSDFEAQENKVCHCFYFFAIYLPWSDSPRCHDLSFLNVDGCVFF